MEDDLERRIADLEAGRAQPPAGSAPSGGRHFRPDYGPEDIEDPSLGRIALTWLREHWVPVAIGVLGVLGVLLTKLERVVPALRQPAPEWVGLVVLAIPFTAVVIYFIVRFLKSQR